MKSLKILPKQLLKTAVPAALCILSFCAGFWFNQVRRSPAQKLLDAAYNTIAVDSIFDQQSDSELSYAAIRGMLNSIDDPYSELIEPEAAHSFKDTFAGQTGVVGLYAENKAGRVVISIVFPGDPAAKAGLRVGDVILAIDQIVLDKDADSSETGLMLRGAPDTSVHLKVQRGEQALEFDLVRQVREYVSYSMLPGNIGYISLTAFNQTASQQMKVGLQALLALQPTGLVWDLRNNEGGDMLAAQEILSYFIEDGLLFTAERTQGRIVQFYAKGKAIAPDLPLAVLMDHTTYSAAETCAAAINERSRGKTIGSNSYGKGLIQATIPLQNDALLQMTIARWRSPDGKWYQGTGVPPQVLIDEDAASTSDRLLQTAVDLLSSQKVFN